MKQRQAQLAGHWRWTAKTTEWPQPPLGCSDIANMVSNCGLEVRQDGVEFGLSLGGDSLFSQHPNTVFQANRWHGETPI